VTRIFGFFELPGRRQRLDPPDDVPVMACAVAGVESVSLVADAG
jgi:hypothetical protein